MTSRDLINRLLAPLGYALERKARGRLAGRHLHEDLQIVLGPKERPVIFDLGANEGQSVREFLRDFDRPRIFAFEPCGATFEKLRARFGSHPDVHLVHAAAGQEEGVAGLRVYERSEMNSLLDFAGETDLAAMGADGLPLVREERVQVVTLDRFCAEHNIAQIDLLKLDCQGAEPAILRGAQRLFAERRIQCLYLEVMFRSLYSGQGSLETYREFLEPFGMQLGGIYKLAFRERRLIHADVVFCRDDSEKPEEKKIPDRPQLSPRPS